MSRQYIPDSKLSTPSEKCLGKSILSQFYLETRPAKLKTSPKHELMSLSPDLTCDEKLPVTSSPLNKRRTPRHQSPNIPIQTAKKDLIPCYNRVTQGDLIRKICQKDDIIQKYRCKLHNKNHQLQQINTMFQNYVSLNKTLLHQCKQKIDYFECQAVNLSQQSQSIILKLKTNYQAQLSNKSQIIQRLYSEVRAQENSICALNLRIKDAVKRERQLSPLPVKLSRQNRKISQISFGEQKVKKDKKKQEILNQVIMDLKQENKKDIKDLQERIAQKQQTIRKMAQFNSEMCQVFLKERQFQSLSGLTALRLVKQNSTAVDSCENSQVSKDSDLFRARSQKQINSLKQMYQTKIMCLQQENSYIHKQYIQIQQQNELIKQYLDSANQKIKKLQEKLKQNAEVIKNQRELIRQKNKETLFFEANSKENMINSNILSSVDEKSKIGNSEHSQSTIKRDLIQGMKQFSIEQISEVSFQVDKTQKILKSPKQQQFSSIGSNKNSSQQQQCFSQANRTKKYLSKLKQQQIIRQKYEIQKSKVTALQQSLNSQRQLNRIMRAKIEAMQKQNNDSKISNQNLITSFDFQKQSDINTNKQSIRQVKKAIQNIFKILQDKANQNQNDSLSSNVGNSRESLNQLKKQVKYHLKKVSQLKNQQSKQKKYFQRPQSCMPKNTAIKLRTQYFISPKKDLICHASKPKTSITLKSP